MMRISLGKKLAFLLLIGHLGMINAQSLYPGQHKGKIGLEVKPQMQAYCFDLADIRLLDSPFKENMERESAWILSLDTKRLLHSFRTNAGTWSDREGGYFTVKKLGGWESLDCDLRGHSTGHIMSGLAMLYAQTGNEVYKLKADSLVKGLAEVQKAIGTGYLSAYSEGLIDRNIAGQGVWAPWYTLHKIFAGLIDQYLYCDNRTALHVAEGMASWAYKKLAPLSAGQRSTMIRNEFGGVNEAFYNLYSITKNPEYEVLAKMFYHEEVLSPLADCNTDFDRKHANTFIPKLIGEARNYEINDHVQGKKLATFFWKTVIDHQTFVTGSNSDKEKFFKNDELSKHLTGYTGESCNTYNMLKLTRHLFCWNTDAAYMDYYEKALFNQILGQQDPATGMISYFLPLLPGAHKVYSTPEHSFWCCVGTGFENQAKYGESVYFHDGKGVFVNLFIPSILDWKEKGVKIRQETSFPESETTTLTIETSGTEVKMPVYLRYPSWTKQVTVTVNNKRINVKQRPGSYILIDRTWKNGDKIEATFPMELRLVETNDDPNKVAVVYGPIVLAGRMGTKGFIKGAPYSNPELYNDYYTYDYNIPADLRKSLNLNRKRLADFIKPVDEGSKLIFKTVNEGIVLEPLYRIHRERYVVYWDI